MADPPQRIRTFDWLRGLAVLFMIQCHALVLLIPALRKERLYAELISWDGLVAPSFIFSAGFSLALVQVRTALGQQGGRARRVLKTLRRLGEVLLVASLVNWMWFPVFREPIWFLRIDILHCIGLALLLALPLTAGLAARPTALAWVSVLLAALCFGVAPLVEQVTGPWARFINQTQPEGTLPSQFPLVPWAGYVYLGACAGAVAAQGRPRRLYVWLAALLAVGVLLWWARAPGLWGTWPGLEALYPAHQFWVTNPANHARRWAWVIGLVLVMLAAERFLAGGWRKSPPIRFLEVFGGSSLAAYFFHLFFLYYRPFGWWVSFHQRWGDRSSWALYWVLTAALITLTFLCAWLTDKVYRRVEVYVQRRFLS